MSNESKVTELTKRIESEGSPCAKTFGFKNNKETTKKTIKSTEIFKDDLRKFTICRI